MKRLTGGKHRSECVDILDGSMRGVEIRDLMGDATERTPESKPRSIEELMELTRFIQDSWKKRL